MPQWVRLSDLLGRTGGSVLTQTACGECTGLANAQELAGHASRGGRSGMRTTLPDEVLWCNKGRTEELTARRSTPARSANQQPAGPLLFVLAESDVVVDRLN